MFITGTEIADLTTLMNFIHSGERDEEMWKRQSFVKMAELLKISVSGSVPEVAATRFPENEIIDIFDDSAAPSVLGKSPRNVTFWDGFDAAELRKLRKSGTSLDISLNQYPLTPRELRRKSVPKTENVPLAKRAGASRAPRKDIAKVVKEEKLNEDYQKEVRNNQCKFCFKLFVNSSERDRHQLRCTKNPVNPPKTCTNCGAGPFMFEGNLNRHVASKHK